MIVCDMSFREAHLRRAMARVLRRTLAQTGFLAGRQLQHNRVLAIRCLAEIIRRHPVLPAMLPSNGLLRIYIDI